MLKWEFEVTIGSANIKVEILANKFPMAMRELGKEILPHFLHAGGYGCGATIKLVNASPVSAVKKAPPLEAPPPPEGVPSPPVLPEMKKEAPTPPAEGKEAIP